MRGKPLNLSGFPNSSRITPADAGKTWQCMVYSRERWDHPRGCGENVTKKTMIAVYMGSPPRMRGKQIQRLIADTPTGITPADAGKTYKKGDIVIGFEDHPRGCGENKKRYKMFSGVKGSPPRMRGKQA